MNLCHGTDINSAKAICRNGIDITKSSPSVDFGPGFYVAPMESKRYVKDWALRKAFLSKACIVTLSCVDDFSNLNVKDFGLITKESSDEQKLAWAQFVVNNRCGIDYVRRVSKSEHNLFGQYDVVKGQIADGSIVRIARQCKAENRLITIEEVDEVLSKNYGEQYAFCTDEAVKSIVRKYAWKGVD